MVRDGKHADFDDPWEVKYVVTYARPSNAGEGGPRGDGTSMMSGGSIVSGGIVNSDFGSMSMSVG